MVPFPTLSDYLQLEHDVARILTEQELFGWAFNESSAQQLAQTLYGELQGITSVLRDRYPYVAGSEFYPKRPNKSYGYYEGCPSTRLKDFSPTSRDHIAWVMQTHHGWKPTLTTESGKPTIDEVVLKEIGTEEALQFFRCLELTKQLGMLSEGKNAWLKLVRNGRIHHNCVVATNTHRCSHRNPNLAQVPSEPEFRSLFMATPGKVMVGADLAGIELRMLAHYLARYDGGRYGEVLLHGDIHQENADKIGISRKLVKTVTYAFLYGAGDQKIGLSFDQSLPPNKAKQEGKEIRQAYMDAIPGLEKLVTDVKKASERGYIKSIDGRQIKVDSSHKALNYLLQSGAGVVAKRWMVIADHANLCEHTHQLAFIHDEVQWETLPASADMWRQYLELMAIEAGEYYNLRIQIAATGKVGNTWADVH